MGAPAAIAFQLVSGLMGAGSNFQAAKSAEAQARAPIDMSGYDAAQAAYRAAVAAEVALQNKQGDIAIEEADAEAQRVAREGQDLIASQELAYTNSGVTLEGSPLQVLGRARDLNREEWQAVNRRGQAQAELNRRQAMITSVTGEAQLFADRSDYMGKQAQNRMSLLSGASTLRRSTFSDLGRLGSSSLLLGGSIFAPKPTPNIPPPGPAITKPNPQKPLKP